MPGSVRQARMLLLVVVATMVSNCLLALFTSGDVVDDLLAADSSLTRSDAETVVTVLLVGVIAVWLVTAAVLAWCAVKFGNRANWARVVVTVLFALYLLSGVFSGLWGPMPWWQRLTVVVFLLIAARILVLLWREESKLWFYRERTAAD